MKYILIILTTVLYSSAIYSQDTRGLSVPHTASPLAEQPGTTYALVVGISTYPNVTPLKYADKDAALFRQYLLSKAGEGVKEKNMLYLINEEAKGATLLVKALGWIENRPYQKGDKLYIYLAGHGDAIDQDEYFFLGYDVSTGDDGAKNNYLAGFTLQMYNLKISIKRIEAKGVQVNLVIDACRTNELAGGAAGQQNFTAGVMEMRNGEMMMLSASPGESSLESQSIGGGHGLFTWYLVDGLSGEADKNKDGKISLFELQSYVSDKVAMEAQTKFGGHEQIPYFCCSEMNSKTIAVVDSDFHNRWINNRFMDSAVNGDVIAMNGKGKRGPEGVEKDTALIRAYNLFTTAIKQNKLTGDSSASWYYRRMAAGYPSASLTDDARYTLAAEYLNYVQGKINIYLEGKDQVSESAYTQLASAGKVKDDEAEHKYRLVATIPYKRAVAMMDSAMALLADNKQLVESLQPKYLFLKVKSFLERKGDMSFDDALALIQKAIKLSPGSAYLYQAEGNLYLDRREYDKALSAYNTVVSLNPEWRYPYNSIGLIYLGQKQYTLAEKYLRKSLSIDSSSYTSSFIWTNMGNLYYALNKPDSAEKYYRIGLSSNAYDPLPCTALGIYFANVNKIDSAEKYYRKALLLDTSYFKAWDGLGLIFLKLNKFDSSEKYLRKSLSLGGSEVDEVVLLYNMGYLFYNFNKSDSAEKYYYKALSLDSSYVLALSMLGSIFAESQRFDTGLKYGLKAVSLDTSNVNAWYNLACTYSLMKNTKDAISILETAIRKGFKNYAHIRVDTDLDNIRSTPEYIALMKKYFPNDYKE